MSTAAVRNTARIAKYGPGVMGYWKQGMQEYPELLSSFGLFLLAFPLGLYKLKITRDGDLDAKVHKLVYRVYRHDDPRIKDLPKYDPDNFRV